MAQYEQHINKCNERDGSERVDFRTEIREVEKLMLSTHAPTLIANQGIFKQFEYCTLSLLYNTSKLLIISFYLVSNGFYEARWCYRN